MFDVAGAVAAAAETAGVVEPRTVSSTFWAGKNCHWSLAFVAEI